VVVHEGKFEPADNGSRWRLAFTNKTMINVGLVSPDWLTIVPRDVTCVDPATQSLPSFLPFSTTWRKEGTPTISATRGIEMLADNYLIAEQTDDLLTNGVCLSGSIVVGGTFRHATATYVSEFSPVVTSPDHHVATPNTLITPSDRAEFAKFVKSIKKL
jgi:hypothetical protein